MWKIFISVLAMSDAGSISTSTLTSDFADRPACDRVAASYARDRQTGSMLGHTFELRVTAECRPGASRMVSAPLPSPEQLIGRMFGMEVR